MKASQHLTYGFSITCDYFKTENSLLFMFVSSLGSEYSQKCAREMCVQNMNSFYISPSVQQGENINVLLGWNNWVVRIVHQSLPRNRLLGCYLKEYHLGSLPTFYLNSKYILLLSIRSHVEECNMMRKIPRIVKSIVSDVFAPLLFFSHLERESWLVSFPVLLSEVWIKRNLNSRNWNSFLYKSYFQIMFWLSKIA